MELDCPLYNRVPHGTNMALSEHAEHPARVRLCASYCKVREHVVVRLRVPGQPCAPPHSTPDYLSHVSPPTPRFSPRTPAFASDTHPALARGRPRAIAHAGACKRTRASTSQPDAHLFLFGRPVRVRNAPLFARLALEMGLACEILFAAPRVVCFPARKRVRERIAPLWHRREPGAERERKRGRDSQESSGMRGRERETGGDYISVRL